MAERKGSFNVLLVGNGAREHAYATRLHNAKRIGNFYCTIGNAGINQIATPVDIGPLEIPRLVQFVADNNIDLVFSGPEAPYAAGLVDQVNDAFKKRPEEERPLTPGPTQAAARIESSKYWAAAFNFRNNIPQPDYISSDSPRVLKGQMARRDYWQGYAVKADELDRGQGVVVCRKIEDANDAIDDFMIRHIHGKDVGNRMIVQEMLEGEELTVMAFVDKDGNLAMLPPSRDHKLFNGKNSGGVRVRAPIAIDRNTWNFINTQIMEKAVDRMQKEGNPFVGILYAGLMLTKNGPRVLEFNCRGGDPEVPSVFRLLGKGFDLLEVLIKCAQGGLRQRDVPVMRGMHNTTVVLCAANYPGAPKIQDVIYGLDKIDELDVEIFHAGTKINDKGEIETSSGRVIDISATADSPEKSAELAYSVAERIHFDGMQYLEPQAA